MMKWLFSKKPEDYLDSKKTSAEEYVQWAAHTDYDPTYPDEQGKARWKDNGKLVYISDEKK